MKISGPGSCQGSRARREDGGRLLLLTEVRCVMMLFLEENETRAVGGVPVRKLLKM